ncbi:hypothetical protein [uncultured Brachyspira sp.]|uniref:hypothetical protein n=1 Tax=uncultured Brachyspira sp. TaxID=221953 RepID=UPI00261BF146|nr:hypothetical protein [uncultured Brachyspira sp.]
MNKKLLTIFLSLFLVGILSISCSNEDKTAPKGIEQYNGKTYVSESAIMDSTYLWVSVKDGQVSTLPSDNITPPDFDTAYFAVTGSGTDYSFSLDSGSVVGTLKFSSDGSSVTLKYTANPDAPAEMLNKDIVCNKR